MYLRITERRNRDGSIVAYYALAESVWNAAAKRPEARVVHNFGRADLVDRAALQRLVNSINRVLDAGEGKRSDMVRTATFVGINTGAAPLLLEVAAQVKPVTLPTVAWASHHKSVDKGS